MSFSLGLEALAEKPELEMTGDILSYEYLDTVIQFHDEAAEAVVIADGIGALCSTFENLGAVCDVLKEHGNTPALEALVGGNFREGFSLENAEKAQDGLWARFVKWLKSLWAKIKAFFAKFFVSAEKMEKALRARCTELANNEMAEVSVSLPKPDALAGINSDIINEINRVMQFCQKDIDGLAVGKLSEASGDLDMLEKYFGEVGQTVTVDKAAAIDLMTKIADHLKALSTVQKSVDSIANKLENASLKVTDEDVENARKEAQGKSRSAAAQQAGEDAATKVKYLGSKDRRAEIMKRHSEATKLLKKATVKAIREGSLCLSSFKVAKVTKKDEKK